MPPPPPPPPYPPGTPEFDSWAAEDEGPTVLALCWFFVALASIFMLGRIYARLHLFKGLKLDDYWCLASIFCAYLASIFTTVAVDYGHGRHIQTLTIHQAEMVRMWTFAAFMPGVFVLGLPKVAVATLLTRLLNPSRAHRWFLWSLVTWCVLSNIATIGTLAGQCTPTRAMWNFDMVPECVNPDHIINFSLYSGAMNAFVDIYLAVYPAIVLSKLQMNLKKKLALSAALGIGAVGGIVAIYKTTRIPDGLRSPDFSYDSADLVYWSIIEASTTIIAATIPTLSPLMEKIFKGRNPFSSFRRSSKRGSKGHSKGSSGGASKGASAQRASHVKNSHDGHVVSFTPRHHLQQDSFSSDLAETIVGDSSEEALPIQKNKEGDVEAGHDHGHIPRLTYGTKVPVREQNYVQGGDLESQRDYREAWTSEKTQEPTREQQHHHVLGSDLDFSGGGVSPLSDGMGEPFEERELVPVPDPVLTSSHHSFHNAARPSNSIASPLRDQTRSPAGTHRTSRFSGSVASGTSSNPRVSNPWTSVQ